MAVVSGLGQAEASSFGVSRTQALGPSSCVFPGAKQGAGSEAEQLGLLRVSPWLLNPLCRNSVPFLFFILIKIDLVHSCCWKALLLRYRAVTASDALVTGWSCVSYSSENTAHLLSQAPPNPRAH